ncbi:MAG: M1 family metallopeptidase [Thermoplasmatales archaeon]
MKIELYDLKFSFKFDELKYSCVETIFGEFDDGLKLDSEGLMIKSVKADGKDVDYKVNGNTLEIPSIKSSSIVISFSGVVSSISLMGIHESRYETGRIITTQMEPTGARSVFPCVDRPDAKARFRIEVNVDSKVEVISNTKPSVRELGENGSHFIFEETPPMSTYLVYIGIGDFDTISKTVQGRTITVATSPGKASEGRFSLNLLQHLLPRYEKYYKIKYPFDKVHLIALPQFGAGAMENWGAITFRELALLYNDSVSFSQKKQIAYTVSHEFAHQWFGDLVTMKWWDDLWLNESFATFVGYKILSKIYPEWGLWQDFLRQETLPSMSKDSLLSTHPVRAAVKSPDEISEIFDEISYGKGASVLRMIEEFIGEEKFKEGVYRYLKRFEYSNATSEDLWNSLSEVSGKDISSLMKSWLNKEGLPVVIVSQENGSIKVSQKRFTYIENNDGYLWEVPLFLKSDKRMRKLLLKEKERKIKVGADVILDPKAAGYYRLLFKGNLLNKILASDPTPEFLGKLIDDYYAFLLSGDIDFSDLSALVSSLRSRDEYTLVLRLGDVLEQLAQIVPTDEIISTASSYYKEKLERFSGSKDENSKVIVDNFSTALAIIDPKFRESEKVKLDDFESIPAERRTSVLISAAMSNYQKDRLWDMLRSPENDVESARAMFAMGMFPDAAAVTEFLNFAVSRTEMRGNLIYALRGSIINREFRAEIWKWLPQNLNTIREIYKGSSSISRLMELAISIDGIGHRQDVDAFLGSNSIPEASAGIKNGLEKLEINEKLIARITRK